MPVSCYSRRIMVGISGIRLVKKNVENDEVMPQACCVSTQSQSKDKRQYPQWFNFGDST